MSWKRWPYWLKGGLIGGALGVFLFWFLVSCENSLGQYDWAGEIRCTLLTLPLLPLTIFLQLIPPFPGAGFVYVTVLIIASFYIGASIGAARARKKARMQSVRSDN